jgi:2-hydroxy-3-keto-5-methylthiopentenyl-1-phosphate phosphatase
VTGTLAVRAAVVDFDGTICPDDVSEELLSRFGEPSWRDIDREFQAGLIGSRECLTRQAALLAAAAEEMLEYAVGRFSVEPSFRRFVSWARGEGLEVAVASDGFGFYVEPMLVAGGIRGLTVLTNETTFGDGGPRFSFAWGHPECVGCGTCKMLAVRTYRERFGSVAFVGEGRSDQYGALYADVVFAKKHLVEICRRKGVPFLVWEDFDDVREALIDIEQGRRPVNPLACPGWTPPDR